MDFVAGTSTSVTIALARCACVGKDVTESTLGVTIAEVVIRVAASIRCAPVMVASLKEGKVMMG